MAKYALVAPDDTILEFRFYDTLPVMSSSPLKPRLLPVVINDVTFDSLTEVREGPALVVEAARVTETYTKRAQNAGELDVTRQAIIDAWGQIERRLGFNQENRIRALERFARAVNNTQATSAGVPTTANAQALTAPQFAAFIKSLF